MPSHFSITARAGAARAGTLRTAHGDVPTPCFMPIATVGAVRHVAPTELRTVGASMILANTYHLMLRPGAEYIRERGGLHQFMGWDGPILTDSGGFQVFSLGVRAAARGGDGFVTLTDDGVQFRSHLDGSTHELTPERVIDIQRILGSDIAMVLDVCPPQPCPPDVLARAVATTAAWASQSLAHADATGARERMQIFGIIQGGSDPELRRSAAAAITALPFDGFAIGGVAVGEEKAAVRHAVELTVPLLPDDYPRYLMGLGTPADIVHAVQNGVDLFDCVLPTRGARHHHVYRWKDRISNFVPEAQPPLAEKFKILNSRCADDAPSDWYEEFTMTNERWKSMDAPIDPECPCLACRTTTLAYLRHLAVIGEALGARLLSLHNLTFYLEVMARIRNEIVVH